MTLENVFVGKFKIVSLYCKIQGQGWTLFKRYGNGSFIWEFGESKTLNFSSGAVACEGNLKENFKTGPGGITGYAYYPSDSQLYIDRSGYAPDGFCDICVNDRYRVERIRDGEYWLYDLEDVKNEPEDYRLRIKIRKIPAGNRTG